jgi:hypothetical protein
MEQLKEWVKAWDYSGAVCHAFDGLVSIHRFFAAPGIFCNAVPWLSWKRHPFFIHRISP